MAVVFTRDGSEFVSTDGAAVESRVISQVVGKSHTSPSATLTLHTTGADWVITFADEATRDAAIDTYKEVYIG